MPLSKADAESMLATDRAHVENVRATMTTKAVDPSVTLLRYDDGSQVAWVWVGGKFKEIKNVTVIDMGPRS